MKRNITTIYDIAKKLGVSPSTVSRSLRDSPGVGEELSDKIKKTAVKMNYRPNTLAQSLKERRTKTIGLLLPHFSTHLYASILNGVEETAFRKHYSVMVYKSDESPQREVTNVHSLGSQVDGLVACPASQNQRFDHFRQLKKQGLPLVFVERTAPRIAAHSVGYRDEAVAFRLTEHLIKSGFKRIALLSGPAEVSTFSDRIQGYREALARHQLPIDERLIKISGLLPHDGRHSYTQLMQLKPPPDSILTLSDVLALAVFSELTKTGLVDQMGLATFGCDPRLRLLRPTVTAIQSRGMEMGSLAAQRCIEQIEGKALRKSQTETVATELLLRGSSVKSSVNDPDRSISRSYRETDGEDMIYIY